MIYINVDGGKSYMDLERYVLMLCIGILILNKDKIRKIKKKKVYIFFKVCLWKMVLKKG